MAEVKNILDALVFDATPFPLKMRGGNTASEAMLFSEQGLVAYILGHDIPDTFLL